MQRGLLGARLCRCCFVGDPPPSLSLLLAAAAMPQQLELALHLRLAPLGDPALPPLVMPADVEGRLARQLEAAADARAPAPLPAGSKDSWPRPGSPELRLKRKWQPTSAAAAANTADGGAPPSSPVPFFLAGRRAGAARPAALPAVLSAGLGGTPARQRSWADVAKAATTAVAAGRGRARGGVRGVGSSVRGTPAEQQQQEDERDLARTLSVEGGLYEPLQRRPRLHSPPGGTASVLGGLAQQLAAESECEAVLQRQLLEAAAAQGGSAPAAAAAAAAAASPGPVLAGGEGVQLPSGTTTTTTTSSLLAQLDALLGEERAASQQLAAAAGRAAALV